PGAVLRLLHLKLRLAAGSVEPSAVMKHVSGHIDSTSNADGLFDGNAKEGFRLRGSIEGDAEGTGIAISDTAADIALAAIELPAKGERSDNVPIEDGARRPQPDGVSRGIP